MGKYVGRREAGLVMKSPGQEGIAIIKVAEASLTWIVGGQLRTRYRS
jgi:hypothetical protein